MLSKQLFKRTHKNPTLGCKILFWAKLLFCAALEEQKALIQHQASASAQQAAHTPRGVRARTAHFQSHSPRRSPELTLHLSAPIQARHGMHFIARLHDGMHTHLSLAGVAAAAQHAVRATRLAKQISSRERGVGNRPIHPNCRPEDDLHCIAPSFT